MLRRERVGEGVSDPTFHKKFTADYPTKDEPELDKSSKDWKKVKVAKVGHRRWVRPLAWILLGFVLNTIVMGLLFWWLVGSPSSRFHLTPARSQLFASDLSVRVNQDYVNREISKAMETTPLNAFGVASISDLNVAFVPNSRMDVTVRLKALDRDFDFTFQDAVAAVDQKVVLTQVGDVKLLALNLPLSALNEVVKQVNQVVENEINRQVGAGQPGDCLTCTNLGRVPTLKSLSTETGTLVAQFDIAIK